MKKGPVFWLTVYIYSTMKTEHMDAPERQRARSKPDPVDLEIQMLFRQREYTNSRVAVSAVAPKD